MCAGVRPSGCQDSRVDVGDMRTSAAMTSEPQPRSPSTQRDTSCRTVCRADPRASGRRRRGTRLCGQSPSAADVTRHTCGSAGWALLRRGFAQCVVKVAQMLPDSSLADVEPLRSLGVGESLRPQPEDPHRSWVDPGACGTPRNARRLPPLASKASGHRPNRTFDVVARRGVMHERSGPRMIGYCGYTERETGLRWAARTCQRPSS
jgi:hypothetical protein